MQKARVKKSKKVTEKTSENSLGPFSTGKDMGGAGINYIRDEMGRYLDGHPGREKRYTNEADLKRDILAYFDYCEQNERALTMTGLAIALGFRTRQALCNYEREPGYEFAFDVIQYAKLKIEEDTEQRLHDPKNYNISGAIFSLKNNWGWVDKSEVKTDARVMQFNGFEIEGLNDSNETIELKED